jgi:hypothetical protein
MLALLANYCMNAYASKRKIFLHFQKIYEIKASYVLIKSSILEICNILQ